MEKNSGKELLDLTHDHLRRVQAAWDIPTDWTDLSIYGFLCLEAAVMAAAEYLGWSVRPNHREKAEAAERLSNEFGLPDIYDLLLDLNSARKAAAYGDISFPELDAKDVATEIENYVEVIELFISKTKSNE